MSVRAGAGVDLAIARYDAIVGTQRRTQTKAGLGLEIGAGVWFAPAASSTIA